MRRILEGLIGAGRKLRSSALLLTVLAAPIAMHAQTPLIIGYPANFDAYNNTGSPVYGFEIEADGIQPGDVTRVFGGVWVAGQPCVIRYCQGDVVPFQGGVYIRWHAPWDSVAQQFTMSTPIPNGTVATGESCWTMGLGARYSAAGCEHFGISTTRMWTNIVYHWLVPDPNNPGQLVYYSGNGVAVPGAPPPTPIAVPIPQPAINVVPVNQAGGGVAVAFEIQAAPPPPAPAPVPQYGDAQWVKVFKQDLPHKVELNDLMGGNPAVPEDPAELETGWKLLQYDPTSNGKGGVLRNQAALANGSHAVVRRYEHYKYAGAYDPATHQALCVDPTCSAPQGGELGPIIGAQNAAANLDIPSINITRVGSGSVSDKTAKISCGNTCFAALPAGTILNLTASAPSNGVFTGWSGDCTGAQPTCTVTINGAMNVTATFATTNTLAVSRGSGGVIAGNPNGEFGTFINCGSSCSAKFQQGSTVTLTATPSAGAIFTGWSGACSGTVPTCTVTMTADMKVQANFK